MPTETHIPVHPFFGGFVLETLTIGMYGESKNAIREYIQNGFDSIQRAVQTGLLGNDDGKIQIRIDPHSRSLTIRDNGTGIPARHATDVLTRVGASTKDHKKTAGFRGIGRLAGIVFADTLTFVSKAPGDRTVTTVVFDAKRMRDEMAPGRASSQSATDLMEETVSAHRTRTRRLDDHYFEVKLEGLTTNAPDECLHTSAMTDFVSQIAPVPYAEDFPFARELAAEAETSRIPIEQVCIIVREGRKKPVSVTKPYGAAHQVGPKTARVETCQIVRSPSRTWWGWIGKKSVSGAYTDDLVAGVRVRVRNIQIDATDLVRRVFRRHAASHARFQDYFVGEIFLKSGVLIPNARRDSFEDNPAWDKFAKELSVVTKKLGSEAYAISKKGTLTVPALRKDVATAKRTFTSLRNSGFENVDRAIAFSKDITTVQRKVSKSLLDATVDALGQLNVLSSELADMKRETLANLSESAFLEDREQLEQETREEMLDEILDLLEDNLTPRCFTEAREILREEYGSDD